MNWNNICRKRNYEKETPNCLCIYRHGKKIYKGWCLNYKKFRRYLADKFRVSKAFLFIGYILSNKYLYNHLKSYGYELVFKPTTKLKMDLVKQKGMLTRSWF